MNSDDIKKIDMKCPQCGAMMNPDAKSEHAKCEYCGYYIIIDKKEDAEEVQKLHEAKSYAYHAGKHRAEEEALKRAKKKSRLGIVAAVVICLCIGCAGLFMIEFSKPALDDPFAYLEVSFSGNDGEGEMDIKVRNNAPDGIDMARVYFSCKQMIDLTEGDIVVVEASSADYRLGITSKRYTVQGLELYLQDVAALTEKQLKMVIEDNFSIQKGNVEYVLEEGETLQITPLRLICHSEGTENELYMISEVSFAVTDVTYYTVSVWDDVIVNEKAETLDLSYGFYEGDLTSVESWRAAMLYDSFNKALNQVEGRQENNTKVSILELK